MGKLNVFTVLAAIVVQFIVGYLWYGPHLFGSVISASGHAINFLKMDTTSLLLIILSGFGLTHILGMLDKLTGTKDMSGGLKLGLTVGTFAIGFPVAMLLDLMGYSAVTVLVIFTYLVLITILTNLVVIKLKHS